MRFHIRNSSNMRLTAAIIASVVLCASITQAATEPFTIVAIPDIQNEVDYAPAMLKSQVDWIVNNKVDQNIAFVAQLGDLTNNGTTTQFQKAWNQLSRMNDVSGLAWGTSMGNHDLGSDKGANYDAYFGPSKFAGKSWYGESTFGHSSYQIFTGGSRQYLMLDLEFEASSTVRTWAQNILDTHPDMPTIINTHEYLNPNGTIATYGTTLWNGLVKDNSQIFMILCGHHHSQGPKNLTQTNTAGQTVYTLMTDYQGNSATDGFNWGNGYLRLLQFDEANSAIHAKVYSPYDTTTPYQTSASAQFDISMNFDGRLGHAPEPGACGMLITGCGGAVVYAWRFRFIDAVRGLVKGAGCRRAKTTR